MRCPATRPTVERDRAATIIATNIKRITPPHSTPKKKSSEPFKNYWKNNFNIFLCVFDLKRFRLKINFKKVPIGIERTLRYRTLYYSKLLSTHYFVNITLSPSPIIILDLYWWMIIACWRVSKIVFRGNLRDSVMYYKL